MPFYNRVSTLVQDSSASVGLNVSSVGYTTIKASRGSLVPIYFPQSSKTKILQLFGKASKAEYAGVWEAIEYNNYRPLWISAPSLNGKYGGVFVTKTGTIPFTNGTDDTNIADLSAIPVTESLGTGNGSTTTFTLTLDKADYYVNQSIDILVDDVSITISATDADPEILTSSPDVGDGTYDRTTGELTFTFDVAPTEGQTIDASYTADLSADTYFVMYNKNPEVDWKAVKISMDTNNVFSIVAELKEGTKYYALPDSPYKISMTENYVDESTGLNLDSDVVFKDDVYFAIQKNDAVAVTTFVDDTVRVNLVGGDRGDTITSTELALGWDYAKNKNKYPADIFFDTTADDTIPGIFGVLRASNQRYAQYILPLPNEDYTDAIATKTGYSLNERGIAVYWNWHLVKDPNTLAQFYTPLTGPIAVRHALMDDVFNGLQPSFINEGTHGGQLTGVSTILESRFDVPDDTVAQQLYEARINAVVSDPTYGFMIIGAKNTVPEETDLSEIGHSRVSDWIIDNIIKQVLVFQVDKLNDTTHRTTVYSKTESIVSAPASAPYNLIRDYAIVCDDTNNTDEVMQRGEFKLDVVIKFRRFSRTIKFLYQVVSQNVDVEEVVGG